MGSMYGKDIQLPRGKSQARVATLDLALKTAVNTIIEKQGERYLRVEVKTNYPITRRTNVSFPGAGRAHSRTYVPELQQRRQAFRQVIWGDLFIPRP